MLCVGRDVDPSLSSSWSFAYDKTFICNIVKKIANKKYSSVWF